MKRNKYDQAFKSEAVKLALSGERLCCINRHCQASLCIIPHDKRL